MNSNNARFWEYINGSFVKLTLKPGQRLHHRHSEPTDEGWSAESKEWEYDEDWSTVNFVSVSEGQDCDGYLSRITEGRCWVVDLNSRPAFMGWNSDYEDLYHDTIKLPKWEYDSAHIHDDAAIAAGY